MTTTNQRTASMRVICYSRVSTEEQINGVSLAAQRERSGQYAALYGLEVVEFIEDAGWSAKNLARPGLQRALTMLKSGEAEGLLVHKLDRLTRSVRDLGDLLDRYFGESFTLFSVTEQVDTRTPGGRMVLNILSSVAQWERETIASRVSCALAHLKGQGRRIGAIPYGSRLTPDGDYLEPEPGEQAVIAEACRLRSSGLSLGKVAAKLAEVGIVSRTGRTFLPVQIDRMVAGATAA